MLALDALSADITAVFYLVAFIALVIGAVLALPVRSALFWVASGLAVWMFVNAWNALAAT